MRVSEEDLAIAGLAKLVGSNLNEIDKFTVQSKNGPANKIDPRQFLAGKAPQIQNKNVVHHQGQAFYAGVDEEMVRSMHPDAPASIPPPVYPNSTSDSQPLPAEIGRAHV
mgnify:CR=1 FL=1